MKIKYGEGKTKYDRGVKIDLTGVEVATAIEVIINGPRTVKVNKMLCNSGSVYVDPSGFVIHKNEKFEGNKVYPKEHMKYISDAKRKANELANSFITKSVFSMSDEELKEERKKAKNFALKCVDEILENIKTVKLYYEDNITLSFNKQYWENVKDEINKL